MRKTKYFIECDECGLEVEEGNHDFHYVEVGLKIDGESCFGEEMYLCEDCYERLKEKGYTFKINRR